MPRFEVYDDAATYGGTTGDTVPVVDAKDAYEAAIMYAARWAPCSLRRLDPEHPGDTFGVFATDGSNRATPDIVLQVWEEEERA